MKTNKLRCVLEYLLILCIVLEFYTPYTVTPFILRVVQLSPILILAILLSISHYSIGHKENAYILIYLFGAIFPLFSISSNAYLGYVLRYVILLPMLWVYLSLRKKRGKEAYLSLFFRYSNVIMVIALLSIVIWLFGSVLHIVSPTAVVPFDWGEHNSVSTYWGVYFETQSVSLWGHSAWRNSAIFNEAPMYNMILCIALTIEYFLKNKRNNLRIWIFILAILTTQTTTGQLFLILLAGWHIHNQMINRYRILLIIMLPFFLVCGYFIVNAIFENKIQSGGIGSIVDRTSDIMTCLQVGIENPILGIGLVNAKGDNLLWYGKEFGFSNSLFAVFARGGLYAITLYLGVLIIIPYRYYLKYRDKTWLLVMLFFFLIFSFTNSYAKYLTFLFLAWGLSNINLKKWQ